jgi:nucleotide-binding universal stress UspA family protein
MPAIERILFPVDFSPQCEGSAHYVQAMAAATKAQVTLLHVANAADYLFTAGELGGYVASDFYQIHREKSKKQLDGFLTGAFPNAKRELCEGEPGSRIAAHAQANDIDLIMMPTHGLGPFRRFLIGSITAKVLHDANCPVWTGVHMETAPPVEAIGFKRIFCAVDLSPEADAALRWAADFAAANGSKLSIIHAVPGIDTRPAKYFDTEFHAELRRQAQFELEKLRERVQANDVEIILVDGDPAHAIPKAVADQKADLLVMARGSAAAGFARLRKHAYDIIRNVPCPTVSV